MEPTKSEVNGVRRTDRRSQNDLNAGLFWSHWERVRQERMYHERKAAEAEERLAEIEAVYMDAQDRCWDGVL